MTTPERACRLWSSPVRLFGRRRAFLSRKGQELVVDERAVVGDPDALAGHQEAPHLLGGPVSP